MESKNKHKFATLVLAAGKGTRMRSALPKVLHRIAGMTMIGHVAEALRPLKPEKTIMVVSLDSAEQTKRALLDSELACEFTIQREQRGTGDAALCGAEFLGGYAGTILILPGDAPLITSATLEKLLEAATSDDLVVLGMRPADPTGYGRLLTDKNGRLEKIIEDRDATEEQKRIPLCNSGVMAVSGRHLLALLKKIQPHNAAGEFYLTDIVALAESQNLRCRTVEADASELLGINSRGQQVEAEAAMQARLRLQAMKNGVTLIAPETVYLSRDTRLGRDVVVHPHVVILPGVVVEDGAEIRSFSHLEGAHVQARAVVGPFARLRPGSVIGESAHVGNFVEIKNSSLGVGAKANHLSYIGDAEVGDRANIGAGTITCNYDGVEKHKTVIGDNAFIGSNTALVAPVKIGAGAVVGAGSVITSDVQADALALTRSTQVNKPSRGKQLRQRKQDD